jgi:hypothetical protein
MAGEGYLSAADLRDYLGKRLFNELFSEEPDMDVADNHPAVVLVLARSYMLVASRLGPIYSARAAESDDGAVSKFLRDAQLDYAHALSYERRPEVGQRYGREKNFDLYKRADTTLANLRADVLRIPDTDTPPAASTARIRGGILTATGKRVVIDSADGTSNGGDF